MKATINFRNVVQAALFECELSGQISDGMWENARPYEHWKVWCNANVNVRPDNVGVNFHAQKDNYNFNSKELLDIVGDRMVNICNMAENNFPLEAIDQFNDWDINIKYPNDEYWNKKRETFKEYFGSNEGYLKAITGSYNRKKLNGELIDMRMIIKTKKSF